MAKSEKPSIARGSAPENSAHSNLPSVPAKVRIVIVEDDRGTREAVSTWIREESSFELIAVFDDPRTALKKIDSIGGAVILVDINMPAMTGIEFVDKARQVNGHAQFLMLTVYGDTDHIFQALRAGASGYLVKTSLREELIQAINEVFRGGSPMTTDVARKVVQSFHRERSSDRPDALLSEREKMVLEKLAAGYLYKEIAAELGVTIATISTFVRRIYVKLQVNSRAQAVAKVMIQK